MGDVVDEVVNHDLFLIEIPGDPPRFVLTERFLSIDPGQGAMGVPWADLEALFRGRTLRAVPLPGRKGDGNRRPTVGPTDPGLASGSGRTNIEINIGGGGG